MPIRYSNSAPTAAPPQHPLWGSLARLAAGVGTTLTQPAELTGLGMAIPAGIAGAGESLAEYLEGSKQSPARIATETALGAVPLSGIFKGGRAIQSAVRSGAYSGVGEAGREYAAGEPLSAGKIGLQTGIGAGTAGLLSKFFGAPAAKAVSNEPEAIVEQTSQRVRPRVIPPSTTPPTPPMGPQLAPSGGRIAYSAEQPAPYRSAAKQNIAQEAKAAKQAAKDTEEQAAADRIQQTIEEQGLVPGKPSVSLSSSAPTEEGRLSQRTPFKKPKPAGSSWTEGDDVPPPTGSVAPGTAPEPSIPDTTTPPLPSIGRAGRAGVKTTEGFNSRIAKLLGAVEPTQEAAILAPQLVEPTVPSEPDALTQFLNPGLKKPGSLLKGPLGATGLNYRLAKEVEGPESLAAQSARDAHLISQGKPPEGPLAGPLARSAAPEAATPLPSQPIDPGAAGGQSLQPPPPDYPAATTAEAKQTLLDRLKELGGFGDKGVGEGNTKGAISPEMLNFLARMGVGGVGGTLIGAHYGHPLQGTLLGLGAGLGSYGITKGIPRGGELLSQSQEGVASALDTLNKVHNSALLSPTSVGKKFAADIGGLSSAALENRDRASALGKVLTGGGLREAAQVGMEAFNKPMTEAATGMENFAQKGPLSWMGRTMGGLTAGTKNLLEQAGFTPEEQAYYTLTSKPQYKGTQKLLEAVQGSKLLQHISPFARIAINRGERGAERLGPLGALFALRPGTDTEQATTALQRALIGTGVMGAAYQATPEDFVKQHPVATSLIAAGGGPYGIPIAAAMAAKTFAKSPGAEVAKTISRDVPGLRLIEDASQSPTALLRNYLSGYTNVLRPVAETISPTEPDITGSVIDKTLSNVPGLREQLPKKAIPRGNAGRPRRVRYN